MKFEKDKEEKIDRVETPDWDEDSRLCPECEGRGFVRLRWRDSDKELCMTCDGLGVVYD